jgi:hypothetical protein
VLAVSQAGSLSQQRQSARSLEARSILTDGLNVPIRVGAKEWQQSVVGRSIGALGSNQSVQRSTDRIHEEGGHAVRCELGE